MVRQVKTCHGSGTIAPLPCNTIFLAHQSSAKVIANVPQLPASIHERRAQYEPYQFQLSPQGEPPAIHGNEHCHADGDCIELSCRRQPLEDTEACGHRDPHCCEDERNLTVAGLESTMRLARRRTLDKASFAILAKLWWDEALMIHMFRTHRGLGEHALPAFGARWHGRVRTRVAGLP